LLSEVDCSLRLCVLLLTGEVVQVVDLLDGHVSFASQFYESESEGMQSCSYLSQWMVNFLLLSVEGRGSVSVQVGGERSYNRNTRTGRCEVDADESSSTPMHFTILRTIQQQPFILVPMKLIKSVAVGTCRVRVVIGKTIHTSVPQLALPRSGQVGKRKKVSEPIVIKEASNTTSTVVETNSHHGTSNGGWGRNEMYSPKRSGQGKNLPSAICSMKQPSGPLSHTKAPISNVLKKNAMVQCKSMYLVTNVIFALNCVVGF
jgi:hypothetical protein